MIRFIKKTLNSPFLRLSLLFIVSIFILLLLVNTFSMEFESPTLNAILGVINYFFKLNALWLVLLIIWENTDPAKTIAWILIMMLHPAIGFLLYILFGKSFNKKRRASKKQQLGGNHGDIITNLECFPVSNANRAMIRLLQENGDWPISTNNSIRIISCGMDKYELLFEAIENAKHHIHLEYYIIKEDKIGEKLLRILRKKAGEGVKVRIIYDDVGSLMLSSDYKSRLEEAGVEILPFFKVKFPVFSRNLNYRNHRKLVIVDGTKGFIGGFNIGEEYIGRSKLLGNWRDLHLLLEGSSVYFMQSIFLGDWNFVSGQDIHGKEFYPTILSDGKKAVQIVPSGPDSKLSSMHRAFIKFISIARKRLWISTPYLVPTETIKNLLIVTAMSGVDVRINIPAKADHFLVYWAGQSNVEELLKAGVRIYHYENGFLHSKMMICDDNVATVGTANLDARSMEINYEVNTFIYDEETVSRLENIFIQDLNNSIEYDYKKFKSRKIYRRLVESFARLFSPLQ